MDRPDPDPTPAKSGCMGKIASRRVARKLGHFPPEPWPAGQGCALVAVKGTASPGVHGGMLSGKPGCKDRSLSAAPPAECPRPAGRGCSRPGTSMTTCPMDRCRYSGRPPAWQKTRFAQAWNPRCNHGPRTFPGCPPPGCLLPGPALTDQPRLPSGARAGAGAPALRACAGSGYHRSPASPGPRNSRYCRSA